MDAAAYTPEQILDFWFKEIEPKQWWQKSDQLDRQITTRFGTLLAAAQHCELFGWRESPQGRLAEIIVLDQFSRNIHRGKPAAFASDPLSLALAQTAIACEADVALETTQRLFLYLPYMHSESALIHVQALALFTRLGLQENLDFELRHKEIIERFGRYPHRNAILGRLSTPNEINFLKKPGSSF